MIRFSIPIRTVSEANPRGEHWGTRARRAKAQRHDAWALTREAFGHDPLPIPPLTVTLTRVAPRKMDSGDDAPMSMKHIRDGIADALRVNDGDERIEWRYAQRKGKPREYAVEVEIQEGRGRKQT